MEKSSNFFLIHNYNTVPLELLEFCKDYLIIDASDQEEVRQELERRGLHTEYVKNTGHNITSYFSYFADHFEELPEVLCLCKGNMLGRHCSRAYFERVYQNTYFTYLYEDRDSRAIFSKTADKGEERIASLVSECQYIEKNSSWYAESENHPNKYFDDFDELLTFIYQDPVIPKYCLFSPGACYIVRREQIRKNSPAFYRNLNRIMNYGLEPNFPSEAHMIERMLPLIFETACPVQLWMEDEAMFEKELSRLELKMKEKKARPGGKLQKIKNILSKVRKE